MKKAVLGCLVLSSLVFGSAQALRIMGDDAVGDHELPVVYWSLLSHSLEGRDAIDVPAAQLILPEKHGDAHKIVKYLIGENRAVNGDSNKAGASVALKSGNKAIVICQKADQKLAHVTGSPKGYHDVICSMRVAQPVSSGQAVQSSGQQQASAGEEVVENNSVESGAAGASSASKRWERNNHQFGA